MSKEKLIEEFLQLTPGGVNAKWLSNALDKALDQYVEELLPERKTGCTFDGLKDPGGDAHCEDCGFNTCLDIIKENRK